MTQEEKQLLLKDLCARLQYGVICTDNRHGDSRVFQVDAEDEERVYYTDFDEWGLIKNCKPYLRPLSSMTEEEYNKYELTFDNVVVYSGHSNNNIHSEHRPTYETFDYLDSIHVDYRDLIPKGLALEAPEGMYTVDALN